MYFCDSSFFSFNIIFLRYFACHCLYVIYINGVGCCKFRALNCWEIYVAQQQVDPDQRYASELANGLLIAFAVLTYLITKENDIWFIYSSYSTD